MNSYRKYVRDNLDNIKRDIKRLVDIKSVGDAPVDGAPYGEGVRRVQLEAMRMCREMGFEVTDCEGRVAYAHYGDPDRFIGIIAHMDVVPAGDGWDSDPFCCTERDGYLVGRGTLDDKAPFVLAAWAAKYLIDNNVKLGYGVRLIIGLDEETGMSDVEYYKRHCKAPVFTFTPDSNFPVGHGEKGIFEGKLVSGPVSGVVKQMHGGLASNVVPDAASALVDGGVRDRLKESENITLSDEGGDVRVSARGRAAHAGFPEGSLNANYVLIKYLRDMDVLSGSERAAADFIIKAMSSYDGAPLGIACDDGLFTPLTVIGGMLDLEDGRFVLDINSRYPTAITPEELESRLKKACGDAGFTLRVEANSGPFYLSPDLPAVQIMNNIYNEVTGKNDKPYVMSGGTYARHLDNAVSYGIEFPGDVFPEWVGGVHMKNEALSIERAAESCEIFIRTLIKLQEVSF